MCADGTLAGWGDNSFGELGNSSEEPSPVPVRVSNSGTLSGKTPASVGAGQFHSVALCADGTLVTWGDNSTGQLGLSGLDFSRVPVAATDSAALSGTTVAAIAAGQTHNPALLTDGTLAAWGDNTFSQLGNGSSSNSSLPVSVKITTLAAGERIISVASGPTASHGICVVAIPLASLAGPSVTTNPATGLTKTTATLQGLANPNGGFTNAFFEYGTTAGYGGVTANLGAGGGNTPANLSAALSGLQPGTLYHYRLVAENSLGLTRGSDATFTTLFLPPTATTGGSAALSSTSVRVNGTVRARNAGAQVVFDYGTDGVSFPNSIGASPSPVSGDVDTAVSADLSNLLQGTTYFYRVRAVSAGGTGTGANMSFQVAILSGLLQQFPAAPPSATGAVTVTLTPSGIPSGWRFVGERQWRASGSTAAAMTSGDREIEFRPVAGHIQPLRESVGVVSGATGIPLERAYYQTAGSGSGAISVTLKPEEMPRAQCLPPSGRNGASWATTTPSGRTAVPRSAACRREPVWWNASR